MKTQTTLNQPKPEDITTGMIDAANHLIICRETAERQREKIDAMHIRLLQEDDYGTTDHKRVWELPDTDARRFYDRVNKELKKMGYDLEPDYCPALIAESAVIESTKKLIEESTAIFPEMTVKKLIGSGLGTYDKYVNLLIKTIQAL